MKNTRKLNSIVARYWYGEMTKYAAAQEMKKAGLCNYDTGCYVKILSTVEKKFRPKS